MKFLNIIYYIFIVFIVAIVGLLIISFFPITGNFKTMIVISGSMEPAIKVGSIIMSNPVDEYRAGDIITFQRKGEKDSTTHRIVELKTTNGESVYITQGDANNAPDIKEVRQSEIKGRVFLTIPYLGYAANFAQKPIGFALLLFIPASIIIFDQSQNIFREIKKKKNKNE